MKISKLKVILILFGVTFLFVCFTNSRLLSTCDAPLVGGHTGAPGETNCTFCHPGTANTGLGTLAFDIGGATQYVPGQTYTATVRIKQTGVNKFGFVNGALQNAGNISIGTLTRIDTIRTRLFLDNGARKYIGHKPCGADAIYADSTEWKFTWTAPLTNVGNITLYLAVLSTNHNHATTGDNTYTKTIVLSPSTLGLTEFSLQSSDISVFPNPASDYFNLDFINKINGKTEINLFNCNGKLISVLFKGELIKGKINKKFEIGEYEKGIYIIQIINSGNSVYKKLMIQ